ncbi:MAG: hypothetical protein LAT68_10870 [Cyclobacteriaceae bacterium]|nr:hypothetical protein [Cyclobacteriaceae bacterium]MCH8516817.1 hypothetical protein [Cyclobacteriaceae bacterium]
MLAHEPIYKQPMPPGFEKHVYHRFFQSKYDAGKVWDWLMDSRTFTDTQFPPFRVEFIEENLSTGFKEGVFTTHHGPLMNLPGQVTRIVDPHYRDLQYLYGSYAISIRWIRPVRLQFWVHPEEEGCQVEVALDSFVKKGWSGIWNSLQKIFWSRFEAWMNRSVKKHKKA